MQEIKTNNVKRVVSKRTKLLFIGFGAASIATASIVCAEIEREAARYTEWNAIARSTIAVRQAK